MLTHTLLSESLLEVREKAGWMELKISHSLFTKKKLF